MARHWLDVARYADSKGYVFNEDRDYPNAYTYRDWVINAFNRDLPYTRFITQQLSADLIPEVKDGDDKRPLAALGFLTVGRRFLNQTPDIIDDRIDVTMRGFEGLTVACARCHDHKFDPIPTQDYYSLYAILNSSQETNAPISEKAIREPWERRNREQIATQASLKELVERDVKLLRKEIQEPAKANAIPSDVKQTLQSIREELLPEGKDLAVVAKAFIPGDREKLDAYQKTLGLLAQNPPRTPEFAMALEDRSDASDGVVFRRGNPGSPGAPAPRRFLLALSKPGLERPHWTHGSGRLELAQAIASRDNPLTARVFVNRVWLHNFGSGIVRTPSDFGHQGEPPTNPDLLDYLASTFMDQGWSVKKLNRLIVTSATYRQASEAPPAVLNADPDNRLWTRMNRKRLDLEEMRDSLAFASGKLDVKKVGGPSVDLWAEPFPERRALYGTIERQNLPNIFRTFDFATPDSTSPKRFQTTVPQQALFFMNSPFAIQQAEQMVHRPEMIAPTNRARVEETYRILFGRAPTAEEEQLGAQFLGSSPTSAIPSLISCWQYGFGAYDVGDQHVRGFTPFTIYKDKSYRATDPFPDRKLGYVTLNSQGGHPGRDIQHCAVRRWTAPVAMTVNLEGELIHGQHEGDGVRGRIVSSRRGSLGEWTVHQSSAQTGLKHVEVQKGETLDYVVDPIANDGYDSFQWTCKVSSEDGKIVWNSSSDFGPMKKSELSRFALYAQALMMTNEFMFVD